MADAKDQDQSMEEILQSIKRIIADEGDPAPASATEVLELTEMLADEEASPSEPSAVPTMSIEEIMAAPLSGTPPVEPEFTPAPVASASPTPAPVEAASAPEPVLANETPEEMLISNTTLAASAAALETLKQPPAAPAPKAAPLTSQSFRSGNTVEDLVMESLRPMLKDWLDSNLPGIVERLVEREVRRLSNR